MTATERTLVVDAIEAAWVRDEPRLQAALVTFQAEHLKRRSKGRRAKACAVMMWPFK